MINLKSKHLLFLIIPSVIISIATYGSLFLEFGGKNTWIICIAAFFIEFIFLYLLTIGFKKEGSYKFMSIAEKSVGKIGKFIFFILLTLTLVFVCIEAAATNSNALHTNLFIETPPWYCLLLFMITAYYICTKSLSAILTTMSISTFFAFFSNLLLSLLSLKYANFDFLLPIYMEKSISEYITCFLLFLGNLSGFFIIFPVIHVLKDKHKFKFFIIIAYIAACILILLNLLSVLFCINPIRASNLYYPIFTVSQRLFFAWFGESGEIFTILMLSFTWISKYLLSYSVICILWNEKIKNKKIFSAIFSVIVFIASYFASKNTYDLFFILKYMQLLFLLVFFIFPFIILIIYFIRSFKNRKKTQI